MTDAEPTKHQTGTPRRASSLWKKIVLVASGGIAAFLAYVAMQPSEFRIARTATIHAPIDDVFAQVNDFHKWQAWSPWARKDPAAKNSFAGEEAGVGAIFKWSGNDDVGEGQMTLTESVPNERIGIQLEFVRPFPDEADVTFVFAPHGDHTDVTWSIHGQNRFVEKLFCLFMDMDQMIGTDFEKGLASIKSIVESPAP